MRGSITATSYGLLVAYDVHDLEPTQIAALVAAMHAVAVRATLSTESGQLKNVITRASDGYLAVYAAGSAAIVAVPGNERPERRHAATFMSRKMIERVAEQAGQPQTPICPRLTRPRCRPRPRRLVATAAMAGCCWYGDLMADLFAGRLSYLARGRFHRRRLELGCALSRAPPGLVGRHPAHVVVCAGGRNWPGARDGKPRPALGDRGPACTGRRG